MVLLEGRKNRPLPNRAKRFQREADEGADDYFAAGGTLDLLFACATFTEPDTESADDTFSDSRLAETIADEVLLDHFVWCKGLGWLGWTGQRWSVATEETVGEAVRQHVLRCFVQATKQSDKDGSKGWYSMLTANRQAAVLRLARGIVERSADEFDSDADLLNTPEGVVHLPSGAVRPHDPDLLMTKMTRGSYARPFTLTFRARLLPGFDLLEYACSENNKDPGRMQGPAEAAYPR